jgi:hypothetical protein
MIEDRNDEFKKLGSLGIDDKNRYLWNSLILS